MDEYKKIIVFRKILPYLTLQEVAYLTSASYYFREQLRVPGWETKVIFHRFKFLTETEVRQNNLVAASREILENALISKDDLYNFAISPNLILNPNGLQGLQNWNYDSGWDVLPGQGYKDRAALFISFPPFSDLIQVIDISQQKGKNFLLGAVIQRADNRAQISISVSFGPQGHEFESEMVDCSNEKDANGLYKWKWCRINSKLPKGAAEAVVKITSSATEGDTGARVGYVLFKIY